MSFHKGDVTCLTSHSNILDHCYKTIKNAYHSVPQAALGHFDHCLVHLVPTYRQKLKSAKPVVNRNSSVTTVESLRFLGTTISQDLKWDNHIDSIVKKAQQRLYFLHQLMKFNLPQELLIQLYSAIIESVLCTSITVWFSSATKSDLRRLRRVVQTAELIIGTTLPTLQELYSSRVSKRAGKITLDPHIQHTPSLNCYRPVNATEL